MSTTNTKFENKIFTMPAGLGHISGKRFIVEDLIVHKKDDKTSNQDWYRVRMLSKSGKRLSYFTSCGEKFLSSFC